MHIDIQRLNEKQLDTSSQIFLNVGTVAIASVAVPAVLDKFNPMLVLLGTTTALLFWMIALWIRK